MGGLGLTCWVFVLITLITAGIVSANGCNTGADELSYGNCDACVDIVELSNYIIAYLNGDVMIADVSASIIAWQEQSMACGYVPWEEAVSILNSGQVEGVMEAHSLDVSLRLKNGSLIKTKEPSIGDIFDEIAKCGVPCESIVIATE